MSTIHRIANVLMVLSTILTGMLPGPLHAQTSWTPAPGWEFRSPAPASERLRVLVIYDMEGLSGVDRPEMTVCLTGDTTAYIQGRERLINDVNAVIEGLLGGGAMEVGVIDRHGAGCTTPIDLPPNQLHPRAAFVDESKGSALDQPWDGVALVGMHAGPGSGGFLEHVGSFGIERVLNGVSVTESDNFALRLGERGIPIIFASGDDRLRQHLSQQLPWAAYVEVKRATSRLSAVPRPADEVRAELRRAAQLALEQRARMRTLALVPPFTGGFRPVYPQTLGRIAELPGIEVREGMIPVTASSAKGLNEAIGRVWMAVAAQGWATMFWEVAKLQPEIVARADSILFARWLAGPPPDRPPP